MWSVWRTLIRQAYLEEREMVLLPCQGEAPERPALPSCLSETSDTRTKGKPSSVFNMLGLYRRPGTQYDQTVDAECDLQGWPLYQEVTYLTPWQLMGYIFHPFTFNLRIFTKTSNFFYLLFIAL